MLGWRRHRRNAGVEIAFRAPNGYFAAGNAAQAVTECWHALGDHAGIGHRNAVARQLILMFFQKRNQIRAADFLLALEQKN